MAHATARLVLALRRTATRLASPEVRYQWSHFGHCNCGHLAQTLTGLTASAIYAAACEAPGDWGEQAARAPDLDFGDRPALDEGAFEPADVLRCGATGAPLDSVFAAMMAAGLDRRDIDALEDLSDGEVRRRLGTSTVPFERNVRQNVIAYLGAWSDLLEARLSDDERARLAVERGADDESLPIAAEE